MAPLILGRPVLSKSVNSEDSVAKNRWNPRPSAKNGNAEKQSATFGNSSEGRNASEVKNGVGRAQDQNGGPSAESKKADIKNGGSNINNNSSNININNSSSNGSSSNSSSSSSDKSATIEELSSAIK